MPESVGPAALGNRERIRALAREANFESGLDILAQFGPARNRSTDRITRSVVLTDDEAVALLDRLLP